MAFVSFDTSAVGPIHLCATRHVGCGSHPFPRLSTCRVRSSVSFLSGGGFPPLGVTGDARIEIPRPSCHSTRWRWVICAFDSFDTSAIRVGVLSWRSPFSCRPRCCCRLYCRSWAWLASSLGSHVIALVRVDGVGLSRSTWPSFRRRWAAASLSNCRGLGWAHTSLCVYFTIPHVIQVESIWKGWIP